LYYQSVYQSDALKKMILGSPSDFKIILNNYIALLSLNAKITKSLEAHYLPFQPPARTFFRQTICIQNKD
jgi:hypothetical protein